MTQSLAAMRLILIFPLLLQYSYTTASECLKRNYGEGNIVCVCNEQHCDTTPTIKEPSSSRVTIYTSNKNGKRFAESYGTFRAGSRPKETIGEEVCKRNYEKEFGACIRHRKSGGKEYSELNKSAEINKNEIKRIVIDQNRIFQRIIGWGGAFTDSTGINIKSLSKNLQEKLIRSYFSKDGIEYSLGRVPIGGTDFSTHGYTYMDTEFDGNYCEDPLLTKFKLAKEDYAYKIPIIKEAKALNNNLLLVAAAWMPPKWMKETLQYQGMFGFLKKSMYKPWANYFVKFLDNYLNNNITFWGITTGNEVYFNAAQRLLPGILWTPGEMSIWIKNYLGPTLRNSQYSDINILAIDDVRPFLTHAVREIMAEPENREFIDGIAIHWYFDNETNAYMLNEINEEYPEKYMLYTEACLGVEEEFNVLLGSWERGEAYANNIIQVINRWVIGWIDWNMALDLRGGPTYIDNFVDSPIIVNATGQEFYKQPMYYALGHFSKFVPRYSARIYSSQCDEDVKVVAFKRLDNAVVVVVMNPTNSTQQRSFYDTIKGELVLNLSPRSITTFLYK
ncbi:putative glucosylceramidase 3 [Diabrotica undecimpunctata]|uniref:putative glucosylceramidase 3 n=1 Tax=Diabrotica undecimpunctata TaxID=50387 RepID=UPI003B632396